MASREDGFTWLQRRTEEYRAGKFHAKEVVEGFDEVGKLGHGFCAVDELEEMNLGQGDVLRPMYVNRGLPKENKHWLAELLHEFKDCFAWEYTEMLGLSRTLVEHALPIKPRFKPYRQPVRNYSPDLMDRIKEEIERLLKANFIRPCRYAEWISNIVPVDKFLSLLHPLFRVPYKEQISKLEFQNMLS
jgi:hypothetical protein